MSDVYKGQVRSRVNGMIIPVPADARRKGFVSRFKVEENGLIFDVDDKTVEAVEVPTGKTVKVAGSAPKSKPTDSAPIGLA